MNTYIGPRSRGDERPNDHDHLATVPDLPPGLPTWMSQHSKDS